MKMIKKFLPHGIVVVVATAFVTTLLSVNALRDWPAKIDLQVYTPAPQGGINVSAWSTFHSDTLGLSLKYPKEWGSELRTPKGYVRFYSPDNKCAIVTGVYPTDLGQTVEKWFIEKWDLGGFDSEVLSYEFVNIAGGKGILANFAEPPLRYNEPRKMGDLPLNPTIMVGLYLPVPKEDYVFSMILLPAYDENDLLSGCKDVFNLMTKNLNLKERNIENE